MTIFALSTSRFPKALVAILAAFFVSSSVLAVIGLNHAARGLESEILRYLIGWQIKICFLILVWTSVQHDRYGFLNRYVQLTCILSLLVIVFAVLNYSKIWPFGFGLYQHSETKIVYNFYLTYSSSVRVINGDIYPRLSSYLDEPGAYAMLCSISLLLVRFSYATKTRLRYFLLITGGLLSFSLAFYIFIMMFALITIKRQNLKFFVISVLILVFIYFQIPSINSMGDLIINRLQFKDGSFTGDNRFYNSVWPENYIFGDGLQGKRDSVINEIRNLGILGFVISYMPLLLLIFFGSMRSRAFACILFVLLLQRPVIDKLYILLPLFSVLFITFRAKYDHDKI